MHADEKEVEMEEGGRRREEEGGGLESDDLVRVGAYSG